MGDKGMLYDKKRYAFLKSNHIFPKNHPILALKRKKKSTEPVNISVLVLRQINT